MKEELGEGYDKDRETIDKENEKVVNIDKFFGRA